MADLSTIDFALYCTKGSFLAVREKGQDAGIVVQYNPGDELAVKVDGDTITYERNDEVIFTSEQKPVFPLVVSAAFCDRGARAAAIEMGLLLV